MSVVVRGNLNLGHAAPAQALRIRRDKRHAVGLALKKRRELLRRLFIRERGANIGTDEIANRALFLVSGSIGLRFLDRVVTEGKHAIKNPAHESENRQRQNNFDESETVWPSTRDARGN